MATKEQIQSQIAAKEKEIVKLKGQLREFQEEMADHKDLIALAQQSRNQEDMQLGRKLYNAAMDKAEKLYNLIDVANAQLAGLKGDFGKAIRAETVAKQQAANNNSVGRAPSRTFR